METTQEKKSGICMVWDAQANTLAVIRTEEGEAGFQKFYTYDGREFAYENDALFQPARNCPVHARIRTGSNKRLFN